MLIYASLWKLQTSSLWLDKWFWFYYFKKTVNRRSRSSETTRLWPLKEISSVGNQRCVTHTSCSVPMKKKKKKHHQCHTGGWKSLRQLPCKALSKYYDISSPSFHSFWQTWVNATRKRCLHLNKNMATPVEKHVCTNELTSDIDCVVYVYVTIAAVHGGFIFIALWTVLMYYVPLPDRMI